MLRLSENVQLTFEGITMGAGTTDLRIFAGHKVAHNVSTPRDSQRKSSQARDHGGGGWGGVHSKAKIEVCLLSGGLFFFVSIFK